MLNQTTRPKTKILVDGGDPAETIRIKELIGFVDGQTTNPSLIAKNPEIMSLVASGHRLSKQEEDAEYKKIVQGISPLVGEKGVSIEVFADMDTKAEEMFAQGKEMFTWISNAVIKYPCTSEGLRAAEMSVKAGMRVNVTLVFSQEQAAAIYTATLGAKRGGVYVSPFVGRLDDRGENGMELIQNIKRMYASGDGHVEILAASIRSIDHLMETFFLECDLATVPTKVLEEWAEKDFPMPAENYSYQPKNLAMIEYKDIGLDQPWGSYNISHPLTDSGIQKFVEDYKKTLKVE